MGHVGDGLHFLWIPDAHLDGRFETRQVALVTREHCLQVTRMTQVKVIEQKVQTSRTSLYLWDPQGAADVDPLGPASRRLHGSALLWTQLALWEDAERTDPAQPAAFWDFLDAVTCLIQDKKIKLSV